jgi:hypothetical protein
MKHYILCEGSSCPHEPTHFYRDRNGKVWALCDLHMSGERSINLPAVIRITREEYIIYPLMVS